MKEDDSMIQTNTSKKQLQVKLKEGSPETAFLTLLEKGCDFDRKYINIQAGENREPEFMRLNPNGVVPVLKDGQKVIVESDKIMEYIDKDFSTGPQLIPDPTTPAGKEVKRLRDLLNEIKIEVATYGLIFHPELSCTGVKFPKMMMKRVRSNYKNAGNIEKMTLYAEKYPDLRDAYLSKIEHYKNMNTGVQEKEKVIQVLDDIDKKCDEFESCLRRSKASVPDGEEFWLTGNQFTAADIVLMILAERMALLGLDARYFNKEKRPLLNNFVERIGKRKSIQMLRAEFEKTMGMMFWMVAKSMLPVVAGVTSLGVAIGVGIWFLKNK